MKLVDKVKKLCTPAYIYLAISTFALVLLMFQNAGNTDKYCVGGYECIVSSTPLLFLVKVIYVVVWTIILNSLCCDGYKKLAWVLLLLPFIIFLIMVILFMASSTKNIIVY